MLGFHQNKTFDKRFGGAQHKRLASHGGPMFPSSKPETRVATNATTPSTVSKKYIGGFGGVGSIYT